MSDDIDIEELRELSARYADAGIGFAAEEKLLASVPRLIAALESARRERDALAAQVAGAKELAEVRNGERNRAVAENETLRDEAARFRSELKQADRYGSERFQEAVKLQAERDSARQQLATVQAELAQARESLSIHRAADGYEIGVLTAERNSLIYGNTVDAACAVRERETVEAIATWLDSEAKSLRAQGNPYRESENYEVWDKADAAESFAEEIREQAWRPTSTRTTTEKGGADE